MDRSFIKLLTDSIQMNWGRLALSNYNGDDFTFGDVGERIVRIRLLLTRAGIAPGECVAIVGKNSAEWVMDFLGIISYGCVAVPIMPDFQISAIHNILQHSESKALFVGREMWTLLDENQLKETDIILAIDNLEVMYAKEENLREEQLSNRLFREAFPYILRFSDMKFHVEDPESLAVISYTSGTSGHSKGVMIPYRALWNNVHWALTTIPGIGPKEKVVSILPLAHLLSLSFEVLTEFCAGMHVYFLGKTPSPRIIQEAFSVCKPLVIVAVPLIFEKIVRKGIFPKLEANPVKTMLKIPVLRNKVYKTVREELMKVVGEGLYCAIIGGAAFNKEVEHFLHKIKFPYAVGYGMTECAPLISYELWETFKEGSVGRAIDNMEIRIDSECPETEAGEILVKGMNVMLGYFKNEEATRKVLTEDGWLRTGDLGVLDKDGFLFIRGRSKNMILGPNGQNIYPEEIEDQINSLPLVGESLVVMRNGKLVALIYPDMDKIAKLKLAMTDARHQLQVSITELNRELPAYEKISSIQVVEKEFEKTPKRSIRRYLYS